MITGHTFDIGAAILVDGEKQKKTANDDQPPSILIAKKAGGQIAPGLSAKDRSRSPMTQAISILLILTMLPAAAFGQHARESISYSREFVSEREVLGDRTEVKMKECTVLMISLSVRAKSHKRWTIERLVQALADAYTTKALGKLDAAHPYLSKVRIVIENSITDVRQVKQVDTFGKAEQWLRRMEREDGTPFRERRPLLRCKRGLCTYDFDGGIDHNHLYLKKISYGYTNRSAYIKTIFLLDGD